MCETHVAPRGLKAPPLGTRAGLLTEPAPQARLEAAARASVVDGLPTFALPVLAGSAGEAIGSGALSFLLQKQLATRDEEEEEQEGRSSATPRAGPTTGTDVLACPLSTSLLFLPQIQEQIVDKVGDVPCGHASQAPVVLAD